ncbi:MAG: hypothetical protein Q9212_000969 [Teloschistes hypoglaucus]
MLFCAALADISHSQVRHIDAQLDRLHWARQSSSSSSPELSAASEETSTGDDSIESSIDSDRLAELQAAIKLVSTASSRDTPLSAELILSALNVAGLSNASSRSNDRGQVQTNSTAEQDLQWLLISKATAQAYGLIINILLEQTLPLGQDIWYWDEVLGSSFYLGLYSAQTAPQRFWRLSKSVYFDARSRFNQSGTVQDVDDQRVTSYSQSWSKFYGLIKDSIRDRSLTSMQSRVTTPLTLYRSEVRSKQQRLRRLREMSACGLGVLVDEGMNLDVDEVGISRAKGNKNEWKTVVLKSVSLMENVLRHLTVLDLGIHDFEDTVFMSVEEDAELTHANTADEDSNQRLIAMVNRLQLILQTHLPNHESSSNYIVERYGRPARLVRYWIPAAAIMLSSTTLLRILVNRKAEISTWVRNLGTTIIGFWYNWVVEPVQKVIGTIRHDKNSEISIMSKESLEGDRASLERMVVDFARDNGSTDEAGIASIRAKVKEGDLTPVLRAYEKDLRNPFIGTIRGELIRALLIQIQKTKVDVEIAVGGIDALLKSQELVFGFVGLTPGVLVCLGLFHWVGGMFGGRKGEREHESRGRMVRLLRNIDRILSASTHSNNGVLSYKDHGMLLCEVHVLRQSARRIMPGQIYTEFLEEISDLVDLQTGVERQIRVVDRMRWAYFTWLR